MLRIIQSFVFLAGADLNAGEAADDEDDDVDGDGNVADKAHDLHPVANTTGALSDVPPTELSQMVQLDLDLQQVGEEGEEWGEGERHSEESNETELDDGFVVVEDECFRRGLHHELLLDVAVHAEVSERYFISGQSSLVDGFLKQCFDLLELAADQHLVLVELEQVHEDLLEDHDDDQVDCQRAEVLIVKNDDKVGNVGVDELEHVDLVDH